MTQGKLKAVVCTATLDLGIDWGDVDLVVNVGAPKGASRIMQRIGRANHRLDEPSKAYLAPTNRFEILECQAALDAIAVAAQDTPDPRVGASTCSRSTCSAGPAPSPSAWRSSTTRSARRALCGLAWEDFEAVVDFVATGRLRAPRLRALRQDQARPDGLWRVRDGRWRSNTG
jgi:ATP-dependent Lhr-like helicase